MDTSINSWSQKNNHTKVKDFYYDTQSSSTVFVNLTPFYSGNCVDIYCKVNLFLLLLKKGFPNVDKNKAAGCYLSGDLLLYKQHLYCLPSIP